MHFQSLLTDIEQGRVLTCQEASQVMHGIVAGDLNEIQIAALLFGLQLRGVYVDEILGFSNTLLELCEPTDLPMDAIDLCGTGGDKKNTFNISTLTSLLVAAMKYPVIKHGNYGSYSITGSSHILESFGYSFTSNKQALKYQFERFGYCYLHAPLFHKTLAKVALIRKQLKLKTIFNILGPLTNPARPKHRFHGVNALPLIRIYTSIFEKRKDLFAIYHTLGGYDEISLTAPFIYATKKGRTLVRPSDNGIDVVHPDTIKNGNTVKESLQMFKNIAEGRGTVQQNKVIAYNAAWAIGLYKNKYTHHNTLFQEGLETLQSGKVNQLLKNIIATQK